MAPISFKIEKKLKDRLGRVGVLKTPHGNIQTPAFVAVGTKATVKSVTPEQLQGVGAEVMIANTYHLFLQPGDDVIKKAGGLHKFMNWNKPVMTDSGGFQVFSLGAAYGKNISKTTKTADPNFLLPAEPEDPDRPKIVTIDPDGVTFKSNLDGSLHYFTPERSMEIQHNLGADMFFAFDECTSPNEPVHYQTEAMDRTHRWARRSLEYHKSKPNKETQALFGIVQGGRHEELRKESAEFVAKLQVSGAADGEFDGFGIGGSFAKEDMSSAVKWCNEILPPEKPRHLLGIGEPGDLFMGAENGVDLFDCVAPTRIGRSGALYTKEGRINIFNAQFVQDFAPADPGCSCYTCTNYTRAYLSHLFRAKEMFAATLASIHNLHFIVSLVKDIRKSMLDDTFFTFRDDFLKRYY